MSHLFNYGCVEKQTNPSEILQETYSLRYQVYIKEWGFEKIDDHPVGLEYDDYDDYSVHFYARCKTEGKVVGTVRTILHSELGFPIEKNFQLNEQLHGVDRSGIGEISRLAVSKEYRKRAIDEVIFGRELYAPEHRQRHFDRAKNSRRECEHELVRGLYLTIYRDSKQRGLTHWYAVMAKGLYVILKRWGISFKQIGPAIWYHGVRAPYVVSINDLESSLSRENPELLDLAREVFR